MTKYEYEIQWVQKDGVHSRTLMEAQHLSTIIAAMESNAKLDRITRVILRNTYEY